MKYCFNCNTMTPGDPPYCDSCGASYNVKLCARMHPNRRSADVCSQCGSRDLSTPQPKVPFWAKALLRLAPIVAGIAVAILSLAFLVAVFRELMRQPNVAFALMVLIALLWWMWSEIPEFIRKFIYRLLKRRQGHEKS